MDAGYWLVCVGACYWLVWLCVWSVIYDDYPVLFPGQAGLVDEVLPEKVKLLLQSSVKVALVK